MFVGRSLPALHSHSGRKAANLKEVGLGGLSGVEKIEDRDGVMHRSLEVLE